MKRFLCAILVSGAFAFTAGAQETAPSTTKFTTAQAGEHVGETVTVCGLVADSRYLADTARRPTFLNFDNPFPRHTFTAVILGDDRAKFTEAPEVFYKGKKVCVTGLIKISHSRPEVEITDPSQITVEESAPAEAPSAPAATTPAATETAPAAAK